jgi:hypothetical protein
LLFAFAFAFVYCVLCIVCMYLRDQPVFV